MDRLLKLQQKIAGRADLERDPALIDRLCVTRVGERIHIDFFGDPFGESYHDLLGVLAGPDVAEALGSLELRGPDEGANGTRNWDLRAIAESDGELPNLRHLSIERTKPADHNRSIIGADYDEDGVLAQIIAKAPRIESLIAPSAPNADFFRVGRRPFRFLDIDTGYDHQGFIANLARSSCFPELQVFEFGEYHETYMDDFAAHVTPFENYRELFLSPACASVHVVQWRNPACTPQAFAELKQLTSECQVMIVRWSAEWIRQSAR